MRILSRLLIVVVLLGGLACGSYAFGKYVLSAHLLNTGSNSSTSAAAVKSSIGAAKAMTRQTDFHGDEPKVEVRVLPAGSDGEGPPPASRSSLLRHNEKVRSDQTDASADASAERDVQKEADRADAQISAGSDNEHPRRHSSDSSNPDAAVSSEEPTPGRHSRHHSTTVDSAEPAPEITPNPRDEAPIDGGGVFKTSTSSKKKKKKPAVTATQSGSMVPVPEGEATRAPRVRSHSTVVTDSPVPKPEGDSDSPVPKPE